MYEIYVNEILLESFEIFNYMVDKNYMMIILKYNFLIHKYLIHYTSYFRNSVIYYRYINLTAIILYFYFFECLPIIIHTCVVQI